MLGRPQAAVPGASLPVGDWAVLEIGARSGRAGAAAGQRVAALRLRLMAAHRGVPAGTVVALGQISATGIPAPRKETARASDAAHLTARRTVRMAGLGARLSPGGWSFPLGHVVPVPDTYGALRAGTGWHHGVDLFARRGTPVLAVTAGTVLEAGWNRLGGNRLWLRDGEGNLFYYAHLEAFAEGVRSGLRVRAGQALGVLGSTGQAERTPPHLHFEAHPAPFTAVGYDGSVSPVALLRAWGAGRDAAPAAAPAAPAAWLVATEVER